MTPAGWLEQLSLALTSALIGIYAGLTYYKKQTKPSIACNSLVTGGGVAGFLTFGCSLCNKILVFLIGITGVLTYFDPIRPFLGFLSIGLLSTAIIMKIRQ
ncbi:MAG TPA: hypothetical protein VJB90_01240 [Candidatus Nanoarchaeia archaeon]|nr:hypothetical protein [Candidatus Nanoarchaeia archaeon]